MSRFPLFHGLIFLVISSGVPWNRVSRLGPLPSRKETQRQKSSHLTPYRANYKSKRRLRSGYSRYETTSEPWSTLRNYTPFHLPSHLPWATTHPATPDTLLDWPPNVYSGGTSGTERPLPLLTVTVLKHTCRRLKCWLGSVSGEQGPQSDNSPNIDNPPLTR